MEYIITITFLNGSYKNIRAKSKPEFENNFIKVIDTTGSEHLFNTRFIKAVQIN